MTYHDLYIVIGIGVLFLVFGVFGILWGKKEESGWYGSIPNHVDIREFVDRSPLRPEPNSLKIGGRICITLAIVILLVSAGLYLWGMAPTP